MKVPESGPSLDLRMPLVAVGVWAGTLLGGASITEVGAVSIVAALAAALILVRWGPRRPGVLVVMAALVSLVTAAQVTLIRAHQADQGQIAELAQLRALVEVDAVVTSDARPLRGGWGDRSVWRVSVHGLRHAGQGASLRRPLLVFSEGEGGPDLGARVRLTGRLRPLPDGDLSAQMTLRGEPEVVSEPGIWWRASAALRESIRDAVRHRPTVPRALVPALVDGDDVAIPETVAEDFRETGLTHLLAVSGTNLTLMVGFLVAAARWFRVRGRGLTVVGVLGILGFILLARTEPSVLRAAVMGAVGLLGLGPRGGTRGLRVLAAAVVVLLFIDPGLARSVGFVLSVLATGGILVLAGPLRDSLAAWLPRWLAEAVAVPFAAQLACTPVIAAISGRVSLVAVGANMLAAPAVGPATVLGLAGGLVGLVFAPAGRLLGTPASWGVAWIAGIAERGADLPTPAVSWGTSVPALALLTLASIAVAVGSVRLLRRRVLTIVLTLLLAGVVVVRPGSGLPGPWGGRAWPPPDWVMVACDVGQGDALVLRAGDDAGIVVDAGPDATMIDDCLSDLGVRVVPAVVLTHFHADHVDGLPGVLAGRRVGAVEVTTTLDPPGGVRAVLAAAEEAGTSPTYATAGETRVFGPTSIQILWPPPGDPRAGAGDGSQANDASVVVLAETLGLRILLTGDVEPVSQARLARAYPGLQVDVVKVPHHGSRYQDLDWLASLNAEIALVSVGADNDYGHPAATSLDAAAEAGMDVFRTDLGGDLAVVLRDGVPVVVSRR